jgi:hypothetical protein
VRRITRDRLGLLWTGPPPKRWTEAAEANLHTEMFMVRERPIPKIWGATEREEKHRIHVNGKWRDYEDACRRRGLPVALPMWDGPAAPTVYVACT